MDICGSPQHFPFPDPAGGGQYNNQRHALQRQHSAASYTQFNPHASLQQQQQHMVGLQSPPGIRPNMHTRMDTSPTGQFPMSQFNSHQMEP